MILMLLDHTRQIAGPVPFPTNYLELTSVGYFMVRWITHIAAPAFLLLAGVAAFLYERKRGTPDTVRFLWTRGLWLILLELTLVKLGWQDFRSTYFGFGGFILQVIWVIGVGMLTLAALIRAPRWVGWLFTLILIVGHNSLDWIRPRHLGPFVKPFAILFRYSTNDVAEGVSFYFSWSLIPWIAVITLGYLVGQLFFRPGEQRRRALFWTGTGLVLAFLILRALNGYGDPDPWTVQDRGPVFTILSFLDVEKSPPSLQFLLMTLGLCFVFLSVFESAGGRVAEYFIAFGRVPLFFYLIHVPVIRITAAAVSYFRFGQTDWWRLHWEEWPQDYEPNVLKVYLFALVLSFVLLPVARWFWGVKKARRHWWLAYL